MGAFDIRPVEDSDQEWVTSLWRTEWGAEFVVAHGEVIHAGGLPGFIAEQDGQRVGLATYLVRGIACELVSLNSLNPGQGIGGALIDCVRESARQRGCSRLFLITTNDNLHALAFYQKHGFRLRALHPGAVDESRKIKPSIPLVAENGIPIRDELELDLEL